MQRQKKILNSIFCFFFIFFVSFSFAWGVEFEEFCVTSLSEGNFNKTDCSIKQEFDGKTYCFGNKTAKPTNADMKTRAHKPYLLSCVTLRLPNATLLIIDSDPPCTRQRSKRLRPKDVQNRPSQA